MIDVASLVAGGIGPTQARLFVDPLAQAAEIYEINTPLREAGFVSQCAYESGMFVHLEENLFYRDWERIQAIFSAVKTSAMAKSLVGNPRGLANLVYANRNGNGDVASGDGWKYRGRGLLQITGRNNYSAATLTLAEPYIDKPDLAATPQDACLIAGWFWDRSGLNKSADRGSVDEMTRAINGSAMEGAAQRRALYKTFFSVFSKPS